MNIQMQNKDFFIKSFIVALLTLLVILVGNELIDWRKYENVFSVSSDASIFAKPNLAKIDLEIIRESNALTIVQQQINQASSALTDNLKAAGIEEKDIKTTNYSISPKYTYYEPERVKRSLSEAKDSYNRETGKSYIYGFRGQINVQVKIRDFDKIDRIIYTSQVTNLTFEIENKDELLAQAREQAIKKAEAKAKKISQEAGVSLGKLINIDVSENGYDIYPQYKMSASPAEDSAQIQPGENEIKIYVSLSYEIK